MSYILMDVGFVTTSVTLTGQLMASPQDEATSARNSFILSHNPGYPVAPRDIPRPIADCPAWPGLRERILGATAG